MIDPVTNRFVGRIFQSFAAAGGRNNLCTQHFHPGHIGCLTLNIFFSHVNDAFHALQRTYRCSRHSMLTSPCFRNDSFFAQFFSQQYLADRIVDLMRTRMTKIFALQKNTVLYFSA